MKKSNTINKTAASLWLGVMMSVATNAQASIDSNNLLDNVLARYSSAASSWASVVTDAASWLFWTLVLISMVWTFGMMAMRKADIGEFFAEFTRFTIFTGFFWWLLINGPNFATDIMDSMRQIGGNATGLGGGLSPSGIVDVGFAIFDKVLDKSSVWSPVNSAVGMIISAIILVILALIGVNMLLLLAAGWILAYGGIFFLGFGGSRWTSDMAINYYKTVLGIAAQLLTMVLLVGIGKTFLDDYYNSMDASMELRQLGVMLVVAVILLMLFNKVPQLIAGIITGASVGGMGIGQFGAGAMVGAAGMATAAASMVGAMAAASAAQGAGGVSALMASISQANTNVAAGNDVLANVFGGSGGPGPSGDGGRNDPGGGGMGTGNTPFAQAAGFASAPIGTAVNPTSSGDGGSTASGSSDSNTQNGIEDT
ncbi:MAG: P-type conjugative transfer protein TrbL, partial [Gammaproteobacteria bacterium]|nr:P-type conjugative transfer protein TrbL [Gammaproteobacteria bacterium]